MSNNKSRYNIRIPLLFSLTMVIGMVIGFQLKDSLRNTESKNKIDQIINLINEKYVDTLKNNALYEDAVNGMLQHLDPHSVYISPDELAAVNEDLDGSFFGIGIEFAIIDDTIRVTSVIPKGPSEKVGLVVGDAILKVEDSLVAGNNITSDRIVKLLRGQQHTKVKVSLLNCINHQSRLVTIERDEIPLVSLDAAIMLDDHTGYIKINRFSATTYKEFLPALKNLKQLGMTNLILDLRDNPGGLLNEAIAVADEFLDDKKLIVYTQGSKSPKEEFHAEKAGIFEKGKLAVLVDEGAASASEILSGAIQDWDRGVIIGRRTFGKGLVQEQFELANGGALRLTIARYYTPSGRCIQRSYAKGKDDYEEDFEHRLASGELTGNDSLAQADSAKYFTNHKRVVYGGGGIKPDVYVPYDTLLFNKSLLNFINSPSFQNVLWHYYVTHSNSLKSFTTKQDFLQHFDSKELLQEMMYAYYKSNPLPPQKIILNISSGNQFELQLKASVARYLFRNDGYYTVFTNGDEMVKRALQVLKDKQYLMVIDGK